MQPQQPPEWLLRCLLLGVVLLAYWNAFGLGIALDGGQLIIGDTRVAALTTANLKLVFTTDYWWPTASDRLYRPLTTLSFLFNRTLGGTSSGFSYHAVNILLHALNVLLVFALARRLLKDLWPAFFAAALWAAHPVGVDSVTNVAGRADLLSAAGILGGLLLFARERNPWGRRAGLFCCAVLAVFSKESGAVLIGLMLLADLVPGLTARRRMLDYALAGAALAVYLAARFYVLSGMPEPFLAFIDNPMRGAGFWEARWTAVKVLALNLGLLVWPAGLTADRSYNQIPIAGPGDPLAWAGLAAALAILGFAIAWRRREPLWFWAAGFFAVNLLPSSNLVVIIGAPMAERFLYLPSIAFAIAVAALVFRFAPLRQARVILSVAIALLAVRAMARNPAWNDNLSLATQDAKVATESWRVRDMHGEFLYGDRKDLDGAIREVEKAWSILEPLPPVRSDPQVPTTLGFYYLIKGDQAGGEKAAEGRTWYARANPLLERAARNARAIQAEMDAAQVRLGKPLLEWRPYKRVFFTLGDSYRSIGRHQDALAAYAEGLQIAPTAEEGFDGAARAYGVLGKPDMVALMHLEKALALGMAPNALLGVKLAYEQLEGGACAVTALGNAQALNVGCQRLRADLCRAVSEVARNFTQARQPARAAALTQMAQQYGCR